MLRAGRTGMRGVSPGLGDTINRGAHSEFLAGVPRAGDQGRDMGRTSEGLCPQEGTVTCLACQPGEQK